MTVNALTVLALAIFGINKFQLQIRQSKCCASLEGPAKLAIENLLNQSLKCYFSYNSQRKYVKPLSAVPYKLSAQDE